MQTVTGDYIYILYIYTSGIIRYCIYICMYIVYMYTCLHVYIYIYILYILYVWNMNSMKYWEVYVMGIQTVAWKKGS